MRLILGVLSLLLVVAVIGLLAKKQLASLGQTTEAAGTAAGVVLPGSPAGATPRQRSEQLQQQMKQAVEQGQQPRPLPDDR